MLCMLPLEKLKINDVEFNLRQISGGQKVGRRCPKSDKSDSV